MEFTINAHDDFASSVYCGVLYIRLSIPFTVKRFTPLDVYKEVVLLVPMDNKLVVERLVCEIVEIYIQSNKQYVVMREKFPKTMATV